MIEDMIVEAVCEQRIVLVWTFECIPVIVQFLRAKDKYAFVARLIVFDN